MSKFIVAVLILLSARTTYARIGINWGRQTLGSLVPSMVVDLLLQNGVKEVKLFNINDDIIRTFCGTNISVTLVIPRLDSITSLDVAREWVQQKIVPFPGVRIKYVVVGNNAFSVAKYTKYPFMAIPRSLKILQKAMDGLGYGHVKAVVTHSLSGTTVLNSTRPSDTTFLPDVMEPMLEILKFINATNTPFIFDFFPIGFLQLYNLDREFAFFDKKTTFTIQDINGVQYHNVMDAAYDSFVWALKKVGFGNLKVSIGQIGWPTDGAEGANVISAERFWKGLLPRIKHNVGTPMRPGIEIDIFINSLVDELRSLSTSPFTRHWGIYRSNGEPKYKIDFTGEGRDIYPTKVKGVNLMPQRWCTLNTYYIDRRKVQRQFDFACQHADCTTLAEGGSCGMLSADEKVSYAFNSYFQVRYQDEEACDFDGLGTVTVVDPSRDTCVFVVNVVQGNKQINPLTRWDRVGDGLDAYGRRE